MTETTEQTTLEEILGVPEEPAVAAPRELGKVEHINLTEIDDFPDHPYNVRDDEEMARLVESVKEQGVVSPAIVRRKEDGHYELISGHRRKHASKLAEKKTMPVLVYDLTDDEAAILMVESNCQREKVLPSEKAYAYKIKNDALKSQGKRNDLTSRPVVGKSESADIVGADSGESGRQIQRYIRLTELIPPFLKMVDEGEMAFRPAVELSYLQKKEQREVLAVMKQEVCTPSLAQALRFKNLSKEKALTPESITSIMQQPKPNQKEQLRIPREKISRFFKEDDSLETINETIIKALEMYRKRERSRDMER